MLQRELVLNLKLGASFSLSRESGEAVLLGSKQQNKSFFKKIYLFLYSRNREVE